MDNKKHQQLNHLFSRIQLLVPQYVEEVRLFVDFLISKQQNSPTQSPRAIKPLLADIEPLSIPVNEVVITRSSMYDEKVQKNILKFIH